MISLGNPNQEIQKWIDTEWQPKYHEDLSKHMFFEALDNECRIKMMYSDARQSGLLVECDDFWEYSVDDGQSWDSIQRIFRNMDGWMILRKGQRVSIRAVGSGMETDKTDPSVRLSDFHATVEPYELGISHYQFVMTGRIISGGNIMSLYHPYMLYHQVPAYGLYGLFKDCSSLIRPPAIDADKIFERGCGCMFSGCSNLEYMPNLPADHVEYLGYDSMFENCVSLLRLADLPAENIGHGAYFNMFAGCKTLFHSPAIFAKAGGHEEFQRMFDQCQQLKQIKFLNMTFDEFKSFMPIDSCIPYGITDTPDVDFIFKK